MTVIRFEESDDRFYIADSGIKGAGRGLFARRKISKGELLVVHGVAMERDKPTDRCTGYGNSYKFAACVTELPNGKIDHGIFTILPLGYAGMVNHTNDPNLINAQITYHRGKDDSGFQHEVAYQFLRDVAPDEEVLGNYGEQINTVLEWKMRQKERSEDEKSHIQRFLDLDLYGLGVLS